MQEHMDIGSREIEILTNPKRNAGDKKIIIIKMKDSLDTKQHRKKSLS